MEYYLDSADLRLIEKALKVFPLSGVTTNPIILARDIEAGMTLKTLLSEIRRLTEGKKLFVQVTREDADGMVSDARKIVEVLGGDVTVKVPCTEAGFEAVSRLKNEGISTCATACYSTSQALLAAKSGADFVAPYVSHLDNLSMDGPAVAGEMARQIREQGMETRVLAASFRTAAQVERCFRGGVPAATVTAEMLEILAAHPGTEKELTAFKTRWDARFDKGIGELLQ